MHHDPPVPRSPFGMHALIARALGVGGLGLLLLAGVAPWFEVPSGFADLPGGKVRLKTAQPRATRPMQAGCLVTAGAVAYHAARRRATDRGAISCGLLLAALMFFPYLVMVWEPALAARAAWLQIQHENLVWLGGDLCTNLEYGRAAWKDHVYMVDTPRQVSLLRVPTPGIESAQLGLLSTLVDGAGYSNRFCEFMRPGWVAALVGGSFALMAECLPGGVLRRRRFALAFWSWAGAVAFGAALTTVPLARASWALRLARESAARGRAAEAAGHLRRAGSILPAIREDTAYVAQMGLLRWRLGDRVGPEARLFLANLKERQGLYDQALEIDRELMRSEPAASPVHREACRALLRAGLHALNGGRVERASALLRAVLDDEPCNLKANYALQLACLRSGRRPELAGLVGRVAATYTRFQFLTRAIVLSSSYDHQFLSDVRAGDMAAAVDHLAKVKKP